MLCNRFKTLTLILILNAMCCHSDNSQSYPALKTLSIASATQNWIIKSTQLLQPIKQLGLRPLYLRIKVMLTINTIEHRNNRILYKAYHSISYYSSPHGSLSFS